MQELQNYFTEQLNKLFVWFTDFFTKVAIYLLIAIVAIVFLTIIILIIKSLFTRERYIQKGRKIEREKVKGNE